MEKKSFYIISIIFLYSCIGCKKDALPDLTETYGYTQTKPFGTLVAKKIIDRSFPGRQLQLNRQAFSQFQARFNDTSSIYFCISRNLLVSQDDAQAMIDYVYLGNTLFISSANLDTGLLYKLFCTQMKADNLPDLDQPNYMLSSVSLVQEINPLDSFIYYYKPFANYFSGIRANNSRIIGYNNSKKPNSFIMYFGKGRLILHCDPRAFSNYFLLSDNNHRYLQQLLQLTGESPSKIYWDDYYWSHDIPLQGDKSFSTFSEIMKYPALAGALWILVFLLSLYVLFNSKRKQNIIPVIKPNENSSIAFTETIARLYMQQKDNKNIADKMITYFNEYVRKSYFLTANATNTDFISALSRKSGVSFEQTTSLFDAIKEVNNSIDVDDHQLLLLNEHLQKFYKTGTDGRKYF